MDVRRPFRSEIVAAVTSGRDEYSTRPDLSSASAWLSRWSSNILNVEYLDRHFAEQLLGDGRGETIPRNQETKVAPLIAVFDFLLKDDKFILSTLPHPVCRNR